MRKSRRFPKLPDLLCGLVILVGCGVLGAGCETANHPHDSSGDAGSQTDGPPAVACMITAPTECPFPVPRYAEVQPIIQQRCVVCHSGQTDRWPLTTYQDVADWYDSVRDQVLNCAMPPPDSGVTMTVDERLAILKWIRCGFPQ